MLNSNMESNDNDYFELSELSLTKYFFVYKIVLRGVNDGELKNKGKT